MHMLVYIRRYVCFRAIKKDQQVTHTHTDKRRPGFSPSMQPLVFWPLLAPRPRQCFSLCAPLVCVCVYDMRDKQKNKTKKNTPDTDTPTHDKNDIPNAFYV